jgi:GGDEF domain-containing protein
MVSAGLAQVEHLRFVQRLAYHDPLTALGNRRLVEDDSIARWRPRPAAGRSPR